MKLDLRHNRDFLAGLLFIVIGVLALVIARDYPMGVAASWFGLVAPAATPKRIVEKLSIETARILKLADVNKRISELGAEPVGSAPQEYAAFIQSEIVKWRKVIRDAGVRLE